MRLTRCLFSHSAAAGLRSLRNDRRGTIAITAALSATVLFGFAGLAIEVASWQVAQLSMQGTADAAAYSAAIEFSKNGGIFSPAQIQAQGIASQQGYAGSCSATVSGATVSVCVKQPPSTASDCTGNPLNTYAGVGAATAIQVVICQQQARSLSAVFPGNNPTVQASAVAAIFPPCILALSPNANAGITVSGGSSVSTLACVIVSDSNSTSGNGATNISGGATVTTPCLFSVGADVITGGSTLNLTQCTTATNGAAPVADPFAAAVQPPQPPTNQISTCPQSGVISPGDYTCQLNTNGLVTFQPGLYYFEQGFNISGGRATGTGVTFFVAGQTGQVNGNATVNFSAPTAANCIPSTCPYVGIVFYGGPNAQNANSFSGGSSSVITGAIYFPTAQVSFTGGSSTLYNSCTQIVAYTITVNGEAQLSDSCNTTPGGTVQLVE